MPVYYRINRPQIISETIDNETVIVNLTNGHYFSLNDTGSAIWEMIEQSASEEDVLSSLSALYGGSKEEIAKEASSFLKLLEKENLITPLPYGGGDTNGKQAINRPGRIQEIFKKPIVQKYEDMQELLLADPIHDVDEMGWPSLKRNVGEDAQAPR